MENTVVYNGVEYTEDEIKELFIGKLKEVWEFVKSVVRDAAEYLAWVAEHIDQIPGYKRLYKQEYLDTCEALSEGKSNNWRKVHGLHLRRKG
ncbi:hypothetical protein [Metabacillus halosaccharovorans]|uniref:hypothetical protein n=1 Tax=Metabacillus halosaccharovorans TaxID=930124 RepID=UPI00203E392A|nr:hypothetical protein [Metabacillus halosaccharovorans]MCM3444367.1 hypothetical protein [Metabacillus halosaccharovorans]